jgi:hypothetical protein
LVHPIYCHQALQNEYRTSEKSILKSLVDQMISLFIDFQIITPTRATTRVAPTERFVGATLVVAPKYFSEHLYSIPDKYVGYTLK